MTGPSNDHFTVERLAEFFAACNAHDTERIAGFFTADGLYLASFGPEDDGTTYRGADEVRRGFEGFFDTYSDGNYTEIELYVDGSRGQAKWTFTGTPAGRDTMSYRGVDIFEFVGDRIALKDAFRKERAAS